MGPMDVFCSCCHQDVTRRDDEDLKKVAIAFADEMKKMYESGRKDKVLLFSFLLISEKLPLKFVKRGYDALKEADFQEFETILKEIHKIELEITLSKKTILSFSDPAYTKALPYVLQHKGCKQLFLNLLLILCEKEESAQDAAWIVAYNLDILSEDVRDALLLKLSENDGAYDSFAMSIYNIFDDLPEDLRNKLLLNLSKRKKVSDWFVDTIVKNFDQLPDDIQQILFELADDEDSAGDVAYVVASNFDILPDEARNLLYKLSEKDDVAKKMTRAMKSNLDKIPENVRDELLLKLSDKAPEGVAQLIIDNYRIIPDEVRDILTELPFKGYGAEDVAWAVEDNLDILPPDIRNELLLKLSDIKDASEAVSLAVASNYDVLSDDIRGLLYKLSEEGARGVARAIIWNYENLPEDICDLLLTLPEKDRARTSGEVAFMVAQYSHMIPAEVRNELLLKLSKNDNRAYYVAKVVAENYHQLPYEIRDLLYRLSEKDKTAGGVGQAILENYVYLPEYIQDLIFDIVERYDDVQFIADALISNYDQIPEDVRYRLTSMISEKEGFEDFPSGWRI